LLSVNVNASNLHCLDVWKKKTAAEINAFWELRCLVSSVLLFNAENGAQKGTD